MRQDPEILFELYDELSSFAAADGGHLDWACGRIYDEICDTLPDKKARDCDREAYEDEFATPTAAADAAQARRWRAEREREEMRDILATPGVDRV